MYKIFMKEDVVSLLFLWININIFKSVNYQLIIFRIYDIIFMVMRMTVTQIINLLHKSIADKSYDLVPTEKNRNSRRKFGLTIYDIEDFLISISEEDLYSGPEVDRDKPNEEVFIFIKEILPGIQFYVKIKKDSRVTYDRIKILSCHEALY